MESAAEPVRIVRHGVVDSTSERAFAELAAGRARHCDVHVARGQTLGRGRLGRPWHSPTDAALLASFVLMPPRPWNAAALTIALGLAALDAVRAVGLDRARLKWPNDVVVDGAKLAGVLAETRNLDPECPQYVAGIGVNVAQRDFPRTLTDERAVTSLALCGIACTVEQLLAELLRAVPARCALVERDLERLEHDFIRGAELAGRVRLESAAGTIAGELVGLSIAGGLVVRDDSGGETRLALEHVRALAAI